MNKLTNKGEIRTAAGAQLVLWGSATYEPGSSITGDGEIHFAAGNHVLTASTFPHTGAITSRDNADLVIDVQKPARLSSAILFGKWTFHEHLSVAGNLLVWGTTELKSTFDVGGNLTVQTGTLNSPPGILILNQPGTVTIARLNVWSGTVTGTADIRVTQLLDLDRATISGSGNFIVESTATFRINSATLQRDFEANAPMTVTRTGASNLAIRLVLDGSTFVHNRDFDLATTNAAIHLVKTTNPGLFINNGSITSSADQVSFDTEVPMVNNGTLRVTGRNSGLAFWDRLTQNGTIEGGGYSGHFVIGSSIEQNGTISLLPGSVLSFAAGFSATYGASSTIVGAGDVVFNGNHTFARASQFQVTGAITFESGLVRFFEPMSLKAAAIKTPAKVEAVAALSLGGAGATFSGELLGAGHITLEGTWSMQPGRISPGGNLTVAPTALVTIASPNSSFFNLHRATENLGTIEAASPGVYFSLGNENLINRGRLNVTGNNGQLVRAGAAMLANQGAIHFDTPSTCFFRVPLLARLLRIGVDERHLAAGIDEIVCKMHRQRRLARADDRRRSAGQALWLEVQQGRGDHPVHCSVSSSISHNSHSLSNAFFRVK